jgi:hypothetical protein
MANPTYDELIARIAELEAGKRTGKAPSLSFKVAEKGGISMYGTGRFPVTLYAETWIKVLEHTTGLPITDMLTSPMIQFISDNRDNGVSFKNGIKELGIPAGYGKQASA